MSGHSKYDHKPTPLPQHAGQTKSKCETCRARITLVAETWRHVRKTND